MINCCRGCGSNLEIMDIGHTSYCSVMCEVQDTAPDEDYEELETWRNLSRSYRLARTVYDAVGAPLSGVEAQALVQSVEALLQHAREVR